MAVQSLKKIMAGMLGAAMLLTAVACGTTDESTDAKAEAKAGFDVSTVKKDDTIAAMLEDEGIEGEDYDPFADYDHDGVSNYNEYRAGTDPFNPDDKLEIKAYAGAQNMLNSLSFEYVGGHIYGVETTLSLTKSPNSPRLRSTART